MTLALQLYTVREDLKKDFKATIKAVAAMGYEGVEFTGNFGGMEPGELAVFVKSAGLVVAGMHTDLDLILDPGSKLYAYAAALGAPYLTVSCNDAVQKDWNAAIEKIAMAAKAARAKGFGFTYHNHAGEFAEIDGKYALDILYAKTDAGLVKCELDTYWIKRGGADPVAYIRKYKGRTPQVHLKDMDPSDQSFTEIGNGCIDLQGVFDAAAYVGANWIIVEQDRWKGTGLESAKISIDNLKKKGLA